MELKDHRVYYGANHELAREPRSVEYTRWFLWSHQKNVRCAGVHYGTTVEWKGQK